MKYLIIFILLSIPFKSLLNAQGNADEAPATLTKEQINDFRDQAQGTISALADYVETIGNKDAPMGARQKAIDLAVKLFMTDSNVVEVSNIQTGKLTRIPVRTYFMKLLWLPYEKVTITWYDVVMASNFDLGKDGRYYGTATVRQKFEGYTSKEYGGRPYIDITKKKIQIIVAKIPEAPGGIESHWRLFLGDISVEETKRQ